jgi:hypothetical protein
VGRAKKNPAQAATWVAAKAAAVLPGERARFIEATETELQSLHEGNMARYRLRPSEFHAWRAKWR